MDDIHITNLRVFLLALYQFPTIPPELQSALQNLPSDLTEMMLGIYKLVEQEPLATKYKECGQLLEARVGVRSKGDRPIIPSNAESTNEHGNEAVDPIDLFESQTESSLTKMMQEIINSPCQDIKSTIDPHLYINPHV